MDPLVTILVACFIAFLFFSFCGWCCRQRKSELMTFTTLTLPANTTEAQIVNTPYPIQQSVMPQTNLPPGQYIPPYPSAGQSYYPPQPQPVFVPVAGCPPYPGYPAVTGSTMQNPPTYDEATSNPNALYNKQAAYNPNFK